MMNFRKVFFDRTAIKAEARKVKVNNESFSLFTFASIKFEWLCRQTTHNSCTHHRSSWSDQFFVKLLSDYQTLKSISLMDHAMCERKKLETPSVKLLQSFKPTFTHFRLNLVFHLEGGLKRNNCDRKTLNGQK